MPRDGTETDAEILSFLQESPRPVSQYQIQKHLNFSSGRVQSAVRRLAAEGKLVKKLELSRNRRRKIVKVWVRDFEPREAAFNSEAGQLEEIVAAIDAGASFTHPRDDEKVVVPVVLSSFESQLLNAIPAVLPQFESLAQFVERALLEGLQRQDQTTKISAIRHLINARAITILQGAEFFQLPPAIAAGKVSLAKGAELLGVTPTQLETALGGAD